MHTTTVDDEDGRLWTVHHNSDFSGAVKVIVEEKDIEEFRAPPSVARDAEEYARQQDAEMRTFTSVRIPFSVMRELVGQYLLGELINHLEDLDGRALLEQMKVPR